MTALYHGGIPGKLVGDLIEPGHERRTHDGCPWCEARAAGGAYLNSDGPSLRIGQVYATTNRLYAKHYASLWGYGDLYRVEPRGELTRSNEDSVETFTAPGFEVVSIYQRAVLLTWSERRRLGREWTEADRAVGWVQ